MSKMHEIPNKLYFRIGEVSDIVGVKPYVLRYWESEFQDIKPSKSRSGQRLYKRRDVEMLIGIKKLLYDERFTIDGARRHLKEVPRGETMGAHEKTPVDKPALKAARFLVKAEVDVSSKKILVKLKKDLESLLEMMRG